VPYLDETLRIAVRSGARDMLQRDGNALLITLQPSSRATLADALEAWYRAEARRVLTERSTIYAAALGLRFGRVTIKDTRSRWGSCSSKGNLNYSWRLMLAPRAVMDYVAAHEVAHLREPNHSARFWALVEAICPDYRAQRAWLREHGRELAAWPGG
jgi:predicted metal-dependent hydrolase